MAAIRGLSRGIPSELGEVGVTCKMLISIMCGMWVCRCAWCSGPLRSAC